MSSSTAWTMIAILGALAPGAASAAQPGNPAAVVQALVEKPPQVLSDLEAVVGSLHRDPARWEQAVGPLLRVSPGPGIARADVELAIDPFHEDPRKVADPSLGHWDLDFPSGREVCRQLLAARFPKMTEFRVDGRRVLRFGDLYLTGLDTADGFRLSWYDREPLFAIPQRSARETAKLVESLAVIAKAGFTRRAIVARFGPLTNDPGWNADVLHTETWDLFYQPAGAAKPKRLSISFKRPLPSRELLPKLGLLKPAVRANDAHAELPVHLRSGETGFDRNRLSDAGGRRLRGESLRRSARVDRHQGEPPDKPRLERKRNADHLLRSPRALASRAGTDVGRAVLSRHAPALSEKDEGAPQRDGASPKETRALPKKTTPLPKKTTPLPKRTRGLPKKTTPLPKKTRGLPKKTRPLPKKTRGLPKKTGPPQKRRALSLQGRGSPRKDGGSPLSGWSRAISPETPSFRREAGLTARSNRSPAPRRPARRPRAGRRSSPWRRSAGRGRGSGKGRAPG